MAKILEYQGITDIPVLTEDPRPGNNGFYMHGRKFDKTTLAPELNKMINWQVQSSGSNWADANGHNNQLYANDLKPFARGAMQLRKPTTSTSGAPTTTTQNDGNTTQDFNAWRTMDAAYRNGHANYVTDGTNKAVHLEWRGSANNYGYGGGWHNMNDTDDLHDIQPTSIPGTNGWYDYWKNNDPTSDTNNSTSGIGNYSTNGYQYPNGHWMCEYGQWPNSNTNRTQSSTNVGTYWHIQHLGKSSVTGKQLYVTSYKGTTGGYCRHKVEQATWNDSTVTVTTKADFNSAPTASGTSQGGNRMNGVQYNAACSSVFTDPNTATKKVWYYPYFDSYNNYHPHVITWDTTDDTFVRETDITVTGDLSVTHFAGSSVYNHSHTFGGTTIYNETFVSGGTRYVTFMYLESRSSRLDGAANLRTWVTYSVAAADPKALTHHSTVTIPKTPRDIVWLNDAHTMFGVFTHGTFLVYTFSAGGGWALATTIAENVYSCGRDSLDRIWYITKSTKYAGGTHPLLNLLTPSLPVTVTLVPASTSYTYAGSNVASSVAVSALNPSGNRLATDIKLVIEGSSMTFTDGTTVKTVTTLTSGDLTVGTLITGAGYNNMSASVSI